MQSQPSCCGSIWGLCLVGIRRQVIHCRSAYKWLGEIPGHVIVVFIFKAWFSTSHRYDSCSSMNYRFSASDVGPNIRKINNTPHINFEKGHCRRYSRASQLVLLLFIFLRKYGTLDSLSEKHRCIYSFVLFQRNIWT